MTGIGSASKRRWIRRSEDEWRELLARFEQSGQTQEHFCSEQGVVLSSFTRWRQKLRHASCSQAVATEQALFVELSAGSSERCWDVELELGAGVLLRLRRPPC